MHTKPSDSLLRPEFTLSLAEQLLKGQSINLLSPHGQGRRRTLKDLRDILPDIMQIFHVNMRDYCSNFKAFCGELASQNGCINTGNDNLAELLDGMTQKACQTLLILHNFDEIRNSQAIAGGYNTTFFQALNSIQERQNMSLLCVCEQVLDHHLIHADGSEVRRSNLTCQLLALPELNPAQLMAELQRNNIALLDETELVALSGWLADHSSPCSILDNLNPDWLKQQYWKQQ
ncbi:hypothetical protein MMIC_P0833 [Mariprofundus micogutta]|uniref:Uncharacterized protein n=1 Tax=Mariprofundus micogutta TaxID=1921010 RepID=A0A1L8CLV5_9PROT|nr:hypothetical protein [Mariprofundus micogutta]GAV19875.1 hypothetical protein MMIC_P0833 [Mariprofundus micogutta]